MRQKSMTLDYIMLWFIISNEPRGDTALVSQSWWTLPLLQHFLCCQWGKYVMKEPIVHWKMPVHLLSGHGAAQITPEQGQKQCSHSCSNVKFRPAEKNKCCCHRRMRPHSVWSGCRTRRKGLKLQQRMLRSHIKRKKKIQRKGCKALAKISQEVVESPCWEAFKKWEVAPGDMRGAQDSAGLMVGFHDLGGLFQP